jgi:cellulose biosynthesis protein BcsQ
MYITVLIQKGGETKSTTTVNLAAAFAQYRPGVVVDTDVQQCRSMKYAGSIPQVQFTHTLPPTANPGEICAG